MNAIERLQEEARFLEELQIKRAELRNKQAKEIGELDNAINQTWTKISSLISMLT